MAEIPVMITVIGSDGEDEVRLQTRGLLLDEADGWSLRYAETDPDSLTETHTRVECRENRVTVVRPGDVLTTISFAQGETFVGEYSTPMGVLMLRVYPSEVRCRRRGGLGHIRLAYQLSLYGSLSPREDAAMRWLDIRFTPCPA